MSSSSTLATITLHVLAERTFYAVGKTCTTWFPSFKVFLPQLHADACELRGLEARLTGDDDPLVPSAQYGVEVTRENFLDELLRLRDAGLIVLSDSTASLTLGAVREAIRIRPSWSRENVTKFWVSNCLKPQDYKKMQALLSRSPALRGRETDVLNAHLLALMSRDGLRVGLLRGESPTPRRLVGWAFKSEKSAYKHRINDALSWCDTVSKSPPGHHEQTSEFPADGLLVVPGRIQPLDEAGTFGGKVTDLSVTDGRLEVENLLLYGERQLAELSPLLKRVDLRNTQGPASRSVDSVITEGLVLNRRAAGTLRELSRNPAGLPIRETPLSKLLVQNGWVVSAVNNHLQITSKGRNALVGWDPTDPFYALRT